MTTSFKSIFKVKCHQITPIIQNQGSLTQLCLSQICLLPSSQERNYFLKLMAIKNCYAQNMWQSDNSIAINVIYRSQMLDTCRVAGSRECRGAHWGWMSIDNDIRNVSSFRSFSLGTDFQANKQNQNNQVKEIFKIWPTLCLGQMKGLHANVWLL